MDIFGRGKMMEVIKKTAKFVINILKELDYLFEEYFPTPFD